MNLVEKAMGIIEAVVGKAKDVGEGAVAKVSETLHRGGDAVEPHAATDQAAQPADAERPRTIPSDGAVTPADVAATVSDPDLPHPEQPTTDETEEPTAEQTP